MEENFDGDNTKLEARPQHDSEVESEIVIQIRKNGDVFIKSFLGKNPNLHSISTIVKSPNKLQETVKMSIFSALLAKGKVEEIKKIKKMSSEPLVKPTEVFGGRR